MKSVWANSVGVKSVWADCAGPKTVWAEVRVSVRICSLSTRRRLDCARISLNNCSSKPSIVISQLLSCCRLPAVLGCTTEPLSCELISRRRRRRHQRQLSRSSPEPPQAPGSWNAVHPRAARPSLAEPQIQLEVVSTVRFRFAT